MVVGNNGRELPWDDYYTGQSTPLYGRDNNWGAFHLAGLVQIDAEIDAHNVELRKACGLVSLSENNLRMFRSVGNRSGDMRQSLWTEYERHHGPLLESLGSGQRRRLQQLVTNVPWYIHDVYCIPCTGKGTIK